MDISSLTFSHHPDGYYASVDHRWVIRPTGSSWVLDLGGGAVNEDFHLLYQKAASQILILFPTPAAAVQALSGVLRPSSSTAPQPLQTQSMGHFAEDSGPSLTLRRAS